MMRRHCATDNITSEFPHILICKKISEDRGVCHHCKVYLCVEMLKVVEQHRTVFFFFFLEVTGQSDSQAAADTGSLLLLLVNASFSAGCPVTLKGERFDCAPKFHKSKRRQNPLSDDASFRLTFLWRLSFKPFLQPDALLSQTVDLSKKLNIYYQNQSSNDKPVPQTYITFHYSSVRMWDDSTFL